ncbi:hypothetical protein [Vibrio sp. TRT 29B02]|uniref:hypothetical protein n=1 Tax=Vibrio sp. TRT 29B02 TaxID=3418508 RepID=UPI003CF6EF07
MHTPSLETVTSELSSYGETSATIGSFYVSIAYVEDSSMFDPREHDNIAVLALEHRRYTLGDTNGLELLEDALSSILDDYGVNEHHELSGESRGSKINMMISLLPSEASKEIIILPVYLYDHSGLAISSTPFSCRFDSGCIGWAFTTPKILNELGHSFTDFSNKKDRTEITSWLKSEIQMYDSYLQGSVFEFTVTNENGEHADSCMGFIGDHDLSGLFESVTDSLSNLVRAEHELLENQKASYLKQLKALIKNRVPLSVRMPVLAERNPYHLA